MLLAPTPETTSRFERLFVWLDRYDGNVVVTSIHSGHSFQFVVHKRFWWTDGERGNIGVEQGVENGVSMVSDFISSSLVLSPDFFNLPLSLLEVVWESPTSWSKHRYNVSLFLEASAFASSDTTAARDDKGLSSFLLRSDRFLSPSNWSISLLSNKGSFGNTEFSLETSFFCFFFSACHHFPMNLFISLSVKRASKNFAWFNLPQQSTPTPIQTSLKNFLSLLFLFWSKRDFMTISRHRFPSWFVSHRIRHCPISQLLEKLILNWSPTEIFRILHNLYGRIILDVPLYPLTQQGGNIYCQEALSSVCRSIVWVVTTSTDDALFVLIVYRLRVAQPFLWAWRTIFPTKLRNQRFRRPGRRRRYWRLWFRYVQLFTLNVNTPSPFSSNFLCFLFGKQIQILRENVFGCSSKAVGQVELDGAHFGGFVHDGPWGRGRGEGDLLQCRGFVRTVGLVLTHLVTVTELLFTEIADEDFRKCRLPRIRCNAIYIILL